MTHIQHKEKSSRWRTPKEVLEDIQDSLDDYKYWMSPQQAVPDFAFAERRRVLIWHERRMLQAISACGNSWAAIFQYWGCSGEGE